LVELIQKKISKIERDRMSSMNMGYFKDILEGNV